MRLALPYPISANRYWRSFVPRGHMRAVVVVSDEAKSYKSQVGWIAKEAGFRRESFGERPIALTFTLVPKNGVTMDLDNALKVAIDALKGVVFADDSQVWRIVAERSEPDGKGALIVEISEFIAKPAPLFAQAAA